MCCCPCVDPISLDVGRRTRPRHPFLAGATPVAIAHRGGAEEAPENTLEAFGAAVALGFRYLETDAHVSRDGVVVAFHDPRLDAATDRQGELAELTIAEIEAADAGWCSPPTEAAASRSAIAPCGSPASSNCCSAGRTRA